MYVFIHIQSAIFTRLLKIEAYSEKTREVLDSLIITFNRLINATVIDKQSELSEKYLASVEAIGSFLFIFQYDIQKSDGDYEDALSSFLEGIDHVESTYEYQKNKLEFSESAVHHDSPGSNVIPTRLQRLYHDLEGWDTETE